MRSDTHPSQDIPGTLVFDSELAMRGYALNKMCYSFNEAANRRGGIQVDELRHEERDHSWLVIVKAVDTITGSSRYGAYEQAKMAGGRPDPFAFTKAVHKAQRNAIKQLLPVPVIKEVLNFYLHRQTSAEDAQIELPTTRSKETISSAQKAAFAIANKIEGRFEQQGITKSDFWNYVKRRYGVESRNDMSEMQWTQLSAELKAAESSPELFKQLIERVRKLDAAAKSSEVPEEKDANPADDDAQEEETPF